MTFKVLTADLKIISRAVVISANKEGAFVSRRANEKAQDSMVEAPKLEGINDGEAEEKEPWRKNRRHQHRTKVRQPPSKA
jgi:hypothetical protein